MADNQSAYIGKIKNESSQKVQAPHQQTAAKKATVKKGKDLRTGNK